MMDPRVTDPNYYDKPLRLKAAAWLMFGLAILVAIVGFMPKKGWELLANIARTIFAGGRHVPRPEGEDEIFPDS